MKNLITICCAVSLLIFVGLACKNNPLAKFTNQYHCTVEGEPQPQTADDYFERAKKHMVDDNYSLKFDQCAFDAVSEGLKLDSQNANGFARRGMLYQYRAKEANSKKDLRGAKSDFESALEDLNEAIRLAPDERLYYDIRSSIYEESRFLDPDLDKTLQDISKAIELSTAENSKASLFSRRGDIYLDVKKDYENAVKDFTEAINLEPENADFYSSRSKAYEKLGKTDLADKDHFKSQQIKFPNNNSSPEIPGSDKKDVPKTISGGVLNEKAIDLPQPKYSPAARIMKASGAVNVQVTVDENGNVTEAKAVSGNPFLHMDAVAAARKAKFKPTLLSGKPVKVTGVIVYNIVPQ